MTTTNPRITITLQPQVHAVVRRLAELTKNSQSALVGELLSDALPVFERMVEVLTAAEQMRAKGNAFSDELKESLERAQNRVETQLGLVMDDFGQGSADLLIEAEKIARRGTAAGKRSAAAVPRSGTTPISNRGVTPLENNRKPAKARKGGLL